MNDKLNKKLAEWADIDLPRVVDSHGKLVAYFEDTLPNFTESLDACFKWLVPKLEPLGYDLEIENDLELMGWSVCLSNTKSECSIASPMEHCELDGIALALCLAIEKLIGR